MDFTRLKDYMDRLVSEYNVPGVDCIVYKNHRELFRYYAGMSDIENGKKMKGDELYIIFSMTKMLTVTCALQLLEQGKYIMSDPVSKYIPEFAKLRLSDAALDTAAATKVATGAAMGADTEEGESGYAKNVMTVGQLFNMTAGLNYDLGAPYIKEAIAAGRTSTLDIVKALAKTPLGFEPGTRYRYSLCHDVLGGLIEVWSGKKFGEYMKENVFDVLGMKDTFFGLPTDEERLGRMTARYIYGPDKKPVRMALKCDYILSPEYESGGAGLVSSAEDYAIFVDALANGGVGKNGGRILSRGSVELMRTNHLSGQTQADFDRKGYGYGLGVRTHIDKTKSGSISPLGEFGWDGAAGAFSLVDPDNELSFVYFQEIHAWDLRIQTEMRNILYSCLD